MFFFWGMLYIGPVFWIVGLIPVLYSRRIARWFAGRPACEYWKCQRCGYNMRTVPGPVCPECGAEHAIKEQSDR